MGNRKRSAERLQAFKDKIREKNGLGSSSRMTIFNDMFFDISFRMSSSCTMRDAISDSEIFKIEYQRYCLHLSSGISELNHIVTPEPQMDNEMDSEDSFESVNSFYEGSTYESPESVELPQTRVELPIVQPILLVTEDQVPDGRHQRTAGLITGYIPADPIPSFDVSKLVLEAESSDRRWRAVTQVPHVLQVLTLCEPYLDCRTKIAVKIAIPDVNFRRPQCRERAINVPLMDPYSLHLDGAESTYPTSRMFNLKFLESKSLSIQRSTRCVCSYPWTLCLFTTEMFVTRELVWQLRARLMKEIPAQVINQHNSLSPVIVAAISRKLGEYGDPSFMINNCNKLVISNGDYIIRGPLFDERRLSGCAYSSSLRRASL